MTTSESARPHSKGPAETIIETVASGLGNSVAWLAEHGVLFAVFAVIWIAFAIGLIFSQGTIDQAWQFIGELPLLVQIVVWLLFLPVMVGLWIWETTWPLVIRLALVIGLAAWNLLVLLPRTSQVARP